MAQGLDFLTIERKIYYCPNLGTWRLVSDIEVFFKEKYPYRPKIIIFDVLGH